MEQQMRLNRLILTLAVILLGAMSAFSQTSTAKSPEALLADLYRVHNAKRGPFFQTKSKALIYKYFEKDLADMIWKDRVNSKGEVGVIDGDPLYDAQDMEIKNFAIGKATYEGGKADIPVSFTNLGEQKSITFNLRKGAAGWRIHDIYYGNGRTMRQDFTGSNR
jgi:Protein of unknown function (DUF3828)